MFKNETAAGQMARFLSTVEEAPSQIGTTSSIQF